MIKLVQWITKQFWFGKLIFWIKEKTEGLFFVIVLTFLVSYSHSEYLNYIEFKNKAPENNIGLSFIIKNTLIGITALGYMYFYFIIKKTRDQIIKKEETDQTKDQTQSNKEMVTNLDEFLNEDELKK